MLRHRLRRSCHHELAATLIATFGAQVDHPKHCRSLVMPPMGLDL